MSTIRLDHIAIAVPRMAQALPFLVGVLGGRPRLGRPAGAFAWGVWEFAGGGHLEVLEPLGQDGFLHRFLAQRGPGLHHVTFKVPSLDAACARAEAQGYKIVGRDDSDPAWREAFLHPKQAQGIVVQLAEASAAAARGPRPTLVLPAGPPDPPPAVTILGLRLRARSRERAETQWGRVLGGEAHEAADGALVYRWPRSPLRLVVAIDPTAGEGPIAVEFTADRAVDVPAGPVPALGTVFVQRPA